MAAVVGYGFAGWLRLLAGFVDGQHPAGVTGSFGSGWELGVPLATVAGVAAARAARRRRAGFLSLSRDDLSAGVVTLVALTALSGVVAWFTGSTLVGGLVGAGGPVGAWLWRRLRGRPTARATWAGRIPAAGEIWWADVQFDEGSGSKDRPVLVLGAHPHGAQVLKVTSQDKQHRAEYLPIPTDPWERRAGRTGNVSWVDVGGVRHLEPAAFRRFAGPCDPHTWAQVCARSPRR